MGPGVTMPHRTYRSSRPPRRIAPAAVALCAVLWLAACGSSSAPASSASTSSSSAAASPPATLPSTTSTTTTSAGPATAAITVSGDPSVAGVIANPVVACLTPTLSGQHISISGIPATAVPNTVSISLEVSAGSVAVLLGSGSADTLRLRRFQGSGVSGFDAGKGAQLSGPVTPVAVASENPGSLGAVTGLSGSVSCGDQTTGTSTIMVTGNTPEGPLSGTMNPFRVTCSTYGGDLYVGVRGVLSIGSTPQLIIVTISTKQIAVAAGGHYYPLDNTGQGVATATGGHVNADVVEANPPAGRNASTLHISGEATCGPS